MVHTSQSPGDSSVAHRLPGPTSSSRPSKLRNFLHRIGRPALLAALTLLLCFSLPGDVKAQMVLITIEFPDNDNEDVLYTEWWYIGKVGEVDYYLLYFKYTDGTAEAFYIKASDLHNPDPGGETSGPKGDRQSLIALAKQHGGKWNSKQEFLDSPLGRMLTGKGKGPGPVINPSDDDAGGGPGDPSRGKEKLGDDYIIDKTGPMGSGKGGGFQF